MNFNRSTTLILKLLLKFVSDNKISFRTKFIYSFNVLTICHMENAPHTMYKTDIDPFGMTTMCRTYIVIPKVMHKLINNYIYVN